MARNNRIEHEHDWIMGTDGYECAVCGRTLHSVEKEEERGATVTSLNLGLGGA